MYVVSSTNLFHNLVSRLSSLKYLLVVACLYKLPVYKCCTTDVVVEMDKSTQVTSSFNALSFE